MDIITASPPRPFYRKYWLPITGAIALGGALAFVGKFHDVGFMLFKESIATATVERGELIVSIAAYGQLEPKGVHWVSAETEGAVAAIRANAGDHVHAGQVLVELDNPQLVRRLRDMELDVEARRAELQAAGVEQDAQHVLLAADIANAELDFQLANKEAEARRELFSRSVQSVSELEMERAEFLAEQQQRRWRALQEQHVKLADARKERMHVDLLRLRQLENSLQDLREQVERLNVRALSAGTVQALDLELGQRVVAGAMLTRITRTDQLIAAVNVPELQVNAIEIGMPARIDTRVSVVDGRVLRIDPAASDGSVRVELALSSLPAEARPALNIEATIELARIADTLYVKRPVGARELAPASMFKLEDSGDFALRVPVQFGRLSSSFVEIMAGLQAGDEVIVSDTGTLTGHERVWLK